jgi:hypothetical protein
MSHLTAAQIRDLVIIGIACLLGFIPAVVASRKGHPFVIWWLFGTFLFVLALPISMRIGQRRVPGLVSCPACGREVTWTATACPHCGHLLENRKPGARHG